MNLRAYVWPLALLPVAWWSSCRKAEDFPETSFNARLSGGSQTVFNQGSGAFSQAFPGLNAWEDRIHETGDIAFEATFVSGNGAQGGLGPVYNNVSCISCHVGDGRGIAPESGGTLTSLLVRLSVPGSGPHGEPLGAPQFGGQLQQRAVFGVSREADVNYTYTYVDGQFADGEPWQLRKPQISIENSYTVLPASLLISARMASPVFGLGLLEALPDADFELLQDPDDRNGDGISGKMNLVWDVTAQTYRPGRFGWKAGQPSIIQQSAGAYVEDMGITNPIFPMESTYGTLLPSDAMPEPELSDSLLHAVAFYVRTLAVPARRNVDDAVVQEGERLFRELQCSSCHTPMRRTGVQVNFPILSNQVIFPYTDLLLHDMGEGLADFRPEFEANGYEWRTAPLWGIGLTSIVNGSTHFLHDGRARNLTEAILWHGGEAQASRDRFTQLSKPQRTALLRFLQNL